MVQYDKLFCGTPGMSIEKSLNLYIRENFQHIGTSTVYKILTLYGPGGLCPLGCPFERKRYKQITLKFRLNLFVRIYFHNFDLSHSCKISNTHKTIFAKNSKK